MYIHKYIYIYIYTYESIRTWIAVACTPPCSFACHRCSPLFITFTHIESCAYVYSESQRKKDIDKQKKKCVYGGERQKEKR